MSTQIKHAKGVRFHEAGGPEVLHLEEVRVPAPGQPEVRLQVKAIGFNRVENCMPGASKCGTRNKDRRSAVFIFWYISCCN